MAESYLGGPGNHTGKTFDKALELFATGATLTDATASSVVHLGPGLVDADLVLNVLSVTGADNAVTVQLSDSAAFGTPVNGVSIKLPADTAGTIILPMRNMVAGSPMAYVRLMPAGTGLKMGAFIAKK